MRGDSQSDGGTPGRSQSTTASDPPCHACKKTAKKAMAVKCLTCGNFCHVTCLVNNFISINGGANKSGTQWLADFLNHGNFRYICQQCLATNTTQQASDAAISDLSARIGDVTARIDCLKNDLSCKFQQLFDATTTYGSNQPTSAAFTTSKPSFADMAATDISKAVKSAVREQRKEDMDRSTVVVYGFPEGGNDQYELSCMFDFLRCNCDILRHRRIGWANSKGKRPSSRPIKVELRNPGDVSLVLSRVRHLRGDAYYEGVNVSRWLTDDDLNGIKALRQKCRDLNSSQPVDSKGRKPFFVTSGKIMSRNA